MTNKSSWQVWLSGEDSQPLYRRLALALQGDIACGLLAPGDRLPTHRELARVLGTTVVTASRAYREAAAWGLVDATVGRGTFVAQGAESAGIGEHSSASFGIAGASGRIDAGAAEEPAGAALETGPTLRAFGSEPMGQPPGIGPARHAFDGTASGGPSWIDLTANYIATPAAELASPRSPGDLRRLWEGLARLHPPGGGIEHRRAVAAWLARPGWAPRPQQIVATAGGQQAILTALAALVPAGGQVFVEELTYHGLKRAARTLGLRLAAVAMDDEGLIPQTLHDLCVGAAGAAGSGASCKVVFVQTTLHNPTTATMPLERRHELVQVARRLDLTLIEDNVYEFLLAAPPLPLAALAPERTLHIVSCAKALARGIRVGHLVAPEAWVPRLAAAVHAGGLPAPGLLDLVTAWTAGGNARRLIEAKRRTVARRQEIAARHLGTARSPEETSTPSLPALAHPRHDGSGRYDRAAGAASPARGSFRSDPASSHGWLTLPAPWRAGAFVDEARNRGVAVQPAATFAVRRRASSAAETAVETRAAVRICLGAPADDSELEEALARLAQLLAAPPPPEEPVV